jgi:hypothetical protein
MKKTAQVGFFLGLECRLLADCKRYHLRKREALGIPSAHRPVLS